MILKLFATGGFVCDNVVAADGTVRLGSLGGNAVYAAAGARLWREGVACAGVVPCNYPDQWLRALQDAGIGTDWVHRVNEAVDDPEWFFHRPDGSRTDQLHAPAEALAAFGLVTNRIAVSDARRFEAHLRTRPPGAGYAAFRARHPVEPRHLPPALPPGTAMHLAPNRMDAQFRLMAFARQAGAVLSFDPGRHAAGMADSEIDRALSLCDIVLPSEKELLAWLPRQDPAAAIWSLIGRGTALVAAKLGAAGSMVHDRQTGITHHVPALPGVAPDPTGAGDAYCGGFLAGWLRTADPVLAACCGTVSASFAVENFGPDRLLAAPSSMVLARLHWVAGQMGRSID